MGPFSWPLDSSTLTTSLIVTRESLIQIIYSFISQKNVNNIENMDRQKETKGHKEQIYSPTQVIST